MGSGWHWSAIVPARARHGHAESTVETTTINWADVHIDTAEKRRPMSRAVVIAIIKKLFAARSRCARLISADYGVVKSIRASHDLVSLSGLLMDSSPVEQ